MTNVLEISTLLHISFSLAAFIFSIVLYILICALGSGEQHKNLTFRTFVITIILGNLISILDNIFRDSGMFPTPVWVQLFLLLFVYLANILLTYYMALYMEGFFGDFRLRPLFFRINTLLMILGVILSVAAYVRQFILYDGEAILTTFPIEFRVILGYAFELYYLIYCLTLFTVFRKTLSARAQMTSIFAFTVVIGSILFELLNTFGVGNGILYNYFGAVIGLYIFYIGVETPDYRNLLQSMSDLEKARQAADEANQSKSDFLASMSHEIRTPINAVLGMNEMILREAEDDAILTYSENIDNAGKTLLGIINDILDFSKIGAGKIEIIPADYDLSTCLNTLVGMISPRAVKKGLTLNIDFDKKTPRFLNGDEVRIKQVITNILTNAVKYTEKGSVTFSVHYEKPEEPDSVILKVSVKDTGIGIKSEDLPKLFSEFERIEEKRNRKIEGTGLGMSITKKLLELMGTSLQVESVYGEGSEFYFSLKQRVTSWEELGDYEASVHEHLNTHKRYRERFRAPEATILVADDNSLNLMVFKSLIKKTGIKVDTAESGDEALVFAGSKKYDVIFLDHMMPEKDGIETLKELISMKGVNSGTPAVCLTANAVSGAREQYISAGFEDYLSKPINSVELEDLLLKYIPDEKISVSKDDDAAIDRDNIIPDELKCLTDPPINIRAGLKNAPDKESYISLLKAFHDSADDRAVELNRFYSDGDLKEYTIRIHALKSSLRIIGALSLGDLAEELEKAGKAEDRDYIRENHESFMKGFRDIKDILSPVIKNAFPENTGKPVIERSHLDKTYGDILDAATNYDTDRLDTIFELLKEYTVPDEDRELFEKIKAAYEQFDYPAVVSLLGQ